MRSKVVQLLPGRVLMSKFRGKLRAVLLQALQAGRLVCSAGVSSARVNMRLNRFGRQTLNVRIREQYAHGHGVVTYLARYLRGGSISNRRLLAVSHSHVTLSLPGPHAVASRRCRRTATRHSARG